jgi:PhnB protein
MSTATPPAAAAVNGVSRPTAILPQLSVRRGRAAIAFYRAAFGAVEEYRVGGTDEHPEVVARLSVDGASFWISDESPAHDNYSPESVTGPTARLLLVVPDPEAVVDRAVAAGATLVHPVVDEHGWRLGRIKDPHGHHWEIGRAAAEDRPIPGAGGDRPSVFRDNAITYLHISADDPHRCARFYQAVFGWNVRDDPDEPAFEDGSGHVIGRWVAGKDRGPVPTDVGFLPYVYVSDIDDVVRRVGPNNGSVIAQPFPEGDLRVAIVRDPAGNTLGVWQRSPTS